jgi:chromosome segregation ATPase
MATTQRFRSALNGFNREDVVNYIEYLNNRHNAQLEQLNNQLQEVKGAVSADVVDDLQAQLDAALARCAELEEKLSVKEASTNRELEAYRRAEEAERKANERAREIYAQAQTALDGATAMAEAAAEEFNQVAERTTQQLKEYQNSIAATVSNFKSAAASLNAVKPE